MNATLIHRGVPRRVSTLRAMCWLVAAITVGTGAWPSTAAAQPISFSAFAPVRSGQTDHAITATSHRGELHVFVTGLDGRIWTNRLGEDGQWAEWGRLPGEFLTNVAPAATAAGGVLYLFAKKTDDDTIHLNTRGPSGSWSGWNPIPGGGVTDVAVAAATFAGRVHVLAKGKEDRRIYMKVLNGPCCEASEWHEVGGTTDRALAAAPFAWGYHGELVLQLFAVGINDRVLYTNSFDGKGFSGWRPLPATTAVAPGAAAFGPSQRELFVFFVGADRRIHSAVWGNPAAADFDLRPFGGSRGSTTEAAVSAVEHRGRLYVFAKGIEDRGIYVSSYPIPR